MRRPAAAVMAIGALFMYAAGTSAAEAPRVAQTPAAMSGKSGAATDKMPGKVAVGAVKDRGTVDAVDMEKGTVTLKGPRGRTLTLEVRDKQKLDAVNVGDPVVAAHIEAVAFQVRKAGTATPGVTTQETRVSSKPGETPAGAIGRAVTGTATTTAIDKKAHTVTIRGPQGGTETVKTEGIRRTSR